MTTLNFSYIVNICMIYCMSRTFSLIFRIHFLLFFTIHTSRFLKRNAKNFTMVSLRGIDFWVLQAMLTLPKDTIIRWHMRKFPRALQCIALTYLQTSRFWHIATERVCSSRSDNRHSYSAHIVRLRSNDDGRHVTIYTAMTLSQSR